MGMHGSHGVTSKYNSLPVCTSKPAFSSIKSVALRVILLFAGIAVALLKLIDFLTA